MSPKNSVFGYNLPSFNISYETNRWPLCTVTKHFPYFALPNTNIAMVARKVRILWANNVCSDIWSNYPDPCSEAPVWVSKLPK